MKTSSHIAGREVYDRRRAPAGCASSPVPLSFVAAVAGRRDGRERRRETRERDPRERRERVAVDDVPEQVGECPCWQVWGHVADEARELRRANPQPAGVRETEVEQVRDRQRGAWRRPVTERDPEQRERDRRDEER